MIEGMRIASAALACRIDRKDLEKWIKLGLVEVVRNDRERMVPNLELDRIRRAVSLMAEADFPPEFAFSLATYLANHKPAFTKDGKGTWQLRLSHNILMAVTLPYPLRPVDLP
jgi:hypothetical protein